MHVKMLLCAMIVLSLAGSYSLAEIDPDKIVGIWLLDEGKDDVAEDAKEVSQNVPKFQLQDQDQTAWLATDRGTGFLSACIMDEVGLFNDALTEDEIQGIMNNGIFHTALAVEPLDKLPVLWGKLKAE